MNWGDTMGKLNVKMVAALIIALAGWVKVAFGIEIGQDIIDQTINLIGVVATIYAAVSMPKHK